MRPKPLHDRSRLLPSRALLPDDLSPILSEIADGSNANGALLSNYVAKYSEDMSAHFDSLRSILNPGATVHYIVGNSTFYGVLVSTERIYEAMFRGYGFANVVVRPIRKRNSKKELIRRIRLVAGPVKFRTPLAAFLSVDFFFGILRTSSKATGLGRSNMRQIVNRPPPSISALG